MNTEENQQNSSFPVTHTLFASFEPWCDSLAGQLRSQPQGSEDIEEQVSHILAQVKTGGDDAVQEFSQRFDGIPQADSRVSLDEPDEAIARLKIGRASCRERV